MAVKGQKMQARLRRLTARERWRLMGFSDDDFDKATAVCSETQLCKQAGNAIVKQVLMAIFKSLFKNQDDKAESKSLLVEFLTDLKRNSHVGENNGSTTDSPCAEIPETEKKNDIEPPKSLPDESVMPAANGVSPKTVPTGIIC